MVPKGLAQAKRAGRMEGGTEPVAQGDPGLFGRRLEDRGIGG